MEMLKIQEFLFGFDLQENLPLDEVFRLLRTSQDGLSSADAEARLLLFGPNKLEEKPVKVPILKFLFIKSTYGLHVI